MTDANPGPRGQRTGLHVVVLLLIALGVLAPTLVRGVPASGQTTGSATPQAATPDTATPMIATPLEDGNDPASFAARGYSDVTAQGMHASATYYFPLPLGSTSDGGTLDLVYSHSPLLVPDLSTMTVLVNGQSVASIHLTEETSAGGMLSVPLPASDDDAVEVKLAFYLRLTRDQCEVPDNPALWAKIHGQSTIHFASDSSAAEPHVVDYPGLLQRSGQEDGPGVTLVLPERPSSEELDAAAAASYQIGVWSGMSHGAPAIASVSSMAPAFDTPAILIGQGSELPLGDGWGNLEWDDEQFILDGAPVPADHGVLAVRQQPVPQLLISGATPEAVRLAVDALIQPLDGDTFDAPVVIVTETPGTAASDTYAWQEGASSFAQLGVSRRDITGPGEHFIDLPFERPAHWVLRDGGTLQLALDVSPAVRRETSWVRVTVNGVDIGSQSIVEDAEGVERYVFSLPPGRLNNDLNGQPVRNLNVQIRVFLDYPDEPCESIDPEAAWATLLPTSAWVLPHDTYEGFDLGRFPTGIASADEEHPVAVVMPELPSDDEMLATMQVVAALGRWNVYQSPAVPRLLTTDRLSDDEAAASPIVLIGGPKRNVAATKLEGSALEGIAPTTQQTVDAPYGILSLGTSPWSDDRAILIVAGSGDDGEGVSLASAALADPDVVTRMQGTKVVVTEDLAAQQIAGAMPENQAPRELAPYVVPDERPWIERISAWQVVGAILLVAVVALVAGVVTLRWIRGGPR